MNVVTHNEQSMAMNQCTAFHVPERMLFQWHVTDRCNLHCSHCYQDNDSHSDLTWNEHLTILEHILSFIRLCQDRNNGRPFRAHVTVTGGEPFVRDDFIPLLERLYEERQFFSLAILTNGTILTPAVVNSLKKVQPGFVQVSIDGTRATHDRIRGKDSYDRTIVGLKCLVNAGIPAYISFTAQRVNYRDFPAVARLGRQLGVTRVWADRMVPCGRGGETAENLLTPAETRGFFALMRRGQKLGWLKSSRVKLHRSLQFTVTGDQPYRCSAGDTLVTILSNGDVCPCRRMPLVIGNIFQTPLAHLYGSSELFLGLRDRKRMSKGCESCFYARTCAGGSRCIAYAVYGDPYRADPGCWLATEG
jgi:radical SAM protein with 4Fe4S-binding SPASM domain